jgi:hypothetical protein
MEGSEEDVDIQKVWTQCLSDATSNRMEKTGKHLNCAARQERTHILPSVVN